MMSLFHWVYRRKRRAGGTAQYHARKEEARALVHARLAHWRAVHPFEHGQVRIKNTRRMWGSCSSKKNLNFNWRLVALPPELADYVVLHELCHTVHLNHSVDFWNLLAAFLPDYHTHRAQLRQHNSALI
jgi:predicted metal-dependent hydrolase